MLKFGQIKTKTMNTQNVNQQIELDLKLYGCCFIEKINETEIRRIDPIKIRFVKHKKQSIFKLFFDKIKSIFYEISKH